MTNITDLTQATTLAAADQFIIRQDGTAQERRIRGDAITVQGTYTPTVTFDTPGDLAVTYAAQAGVWTRVGRLINVMIRIEANSFTHSTASGTLRLGLPFTVRTFTNYKPVGSFLFTGITKAGYTNYTLAMTSGLDHCFVEASGSAVSQSIVTASDIPSSGVKRFIGTIAYETA